jgi:hypothetical protein
MSEILVSMPKSMSDWFAQCMDNAGHDPKYLRLAGETFLQGNTVKLFKVRGMTIEEVHLLLKTYIQTRVNAHEIQVSL